MTHSFNAPQLDGSITVKIIECNEHAKTKDGRTVKAYRVRRYVGYSGNGFIVWSKPFWVVAHRISERAVDQEATSDQS